MRTFCRRLAVAAAGLGLILAALVAATVAPVDRAPHTAQPYAVEARQRLAALAGGATATAPSAGPFLAGFGRARLTPTLGASSDRPEQGEFVALPLAGYGNRKGLPASGVHDDLWVKAVAFASAGRTGVMVAADSLIVPREVAEVAEGMLKERHGLARDQIYFGATHTHCGLGGWGEGWVAEAFAGGFRPAVRIWMAQQLADAAGRALADMAPAAIGHAGFDAPDLVRNRLIGEAGTLDSRFGLLVVQKVSGGQRAVVGAFAAHATVVSGGFMEFSAEYPGAWQRTLEARGVTHALFLAGAVGSHGPKSPKGGIDGAVAMGEALAERTLAALSSATLEQEPLCRMVSLELNLPRLQPRLTDGLAFRPWVARALLPVGVTTQLQAWRLGHAVWLSTPCDYSGELALELRAAGRAAGMEVQVTSFNGDYVGYVVPSKYYGMNGYETRTMAFFGPQLPDYFAEALRGLLSIAVGAPR